MTLTGNDIALLISSTQLALAWHRNGPDKGKSGFSRKEIDNLIALKKRLDGFLDHHASLVERTDGDCAFDVVSQSLQSVTG